ncbi:glycosyltransferase family 2 protein, partial [Campylobacter sp. RM9939]|uniref:glycosyltransferase family 2 protein n=1 Tax=Campylobacter molothri TaxID=1032242 RepID=UPI001D6B310B|nr:glycosyltransferase family 2 protein [Campylobacter sp. RM10536]MBZ7953194.1 glycosyltransferase family 2 protein [Campylobacter sp. RM9939]
QVVHPSCMYMYNQITNWQKDIMNFLATDGINPIGIYQLDFLRINQIKLNESLGASYQDNGLWFQIFSFAKRIYFINEAFYILRRDNPNSSVYSKDKVYAICEEYDFIRDNLRKNPYIEQNIAPICALHRYGNYISTLNRIDDKYKFEFIEKFAKDFEQLFKDNEIDYSIFGFHKIELINTIIENPRMFYYGLIGLKSRIQNQLTYKLGHCYIRANNIFKKILLPLSLLKILFSHHFEQKIYKSILYFRPDLKLPSVSLYSEFLDSILIRNEISYRYGSIILKAFKHWYKGKLFLLPFKLYSLKRSKNA